MPKPPFESQNALELFLVQSSDHQFQKALPFFSLAELADSLTLLHSGSVVDSKVKLGELFTFVDSPMTLEILGSNFSLSLFIDFLNFLVLHPQAQNRLNFILIGLPPAVFSKSLHHLQHDHLEILRQAGLLEPLQYQLTQFIHEGEYLKEAIERKVQQFKEEILSTSPAELTRYSLQSLMHSIDSLRNELIDYLESTSAALAIVWHTDRIDLIEKLSSINETIQHQLSQLIGHPTFQNLAPTGLYLFLDETLASIFDSSLKDGDSAIEGMTRLGIWHLKDYWALGLLSSIQYSDPLDLDPEQFNEQERWIHHQKCVSLIQGRLEQLGIGKVKDLKKFHLFSKSLLKSYIDQHSHQYNA